MTAAAVHTDVPSLREALEAYQDWRTRQARFSLRTWSGEKPGLLAFVDQIGCDRPINTLTDVDLDAWWDALRVADSTRKTRLAQLRSFLRYCHELRGWTDRDPSLLLRAGKVMPTQRQRLTRNELLALLDQARTMRDRILLALAMNLALRGSEIADLRVRDVNLAAAEIEVRIEKTGMTDIMPVTLELDIELRQWLRVYRLACPDLRPESYLVPSQFFQPSNGMTTWRHASKYAEPHRVVQSALEQLGWPSTLREGVHTIRRSVARIAYDMMVAEGDPEALMTTMRLLHHSNPEVTLRYIGYDRQTEARDRFMKRQRFLTRNTSVRPAAFAQ